MGDGGKEREEEREDEEQEEVRPLHLTWTGDEGIHQSPVLHCYLLPIRRITRRTALPERPAGLASKKKTGFLKVHKIAHSKAHHAEKCMECNVGYYNYF